VDHLRSKVLVRNAKGVQQNSSVWPDTIQSCFFFIVKEGPLPRADKASLNNGLSKSLDLANGKQLA